MESRITRRQLVSSSLFGLTAMIAGCTGSERTNETSSNDPDTAVEFVEHEWGVINESKQQYGVQGTIRNVSDHELEYVRLTGSFLDSDNVVLAQPWTAREFVGPGEKALFELPYREDRASSPPSAVEDYELSAQVQSRSGTINDGAISTEEVGWQKVDETINGEPVYGIEGVATNSTENELTKVSFFANFYRENTIVYDSRDAVMGLGPDQSYVFTLGYRGGDRDKIDDHELNITYK